MTTRTTDGTVTDGTVTVTDQGGTPAYALRFERRLAHPQAAVWAAITEPARLAAWIGTVTVDLRVGGGYELHFGGAPDDRLEAVVVELAAPPAAPAVLELATAMPSAPEGRLRWEVSADGPDRSVLVLTHTVPVPDATPSLAAGWHLHLDALPAALDGTARTDHTMTAWRPLHDAYACAFDRPLQVDGEIRATGDETELRFERRLPHPPARVWAALTEAGEAGGWFGDLDADLTGGGTYALSMNGVVVATGRVLEFRPPDGRADGGPAGAAVAYTWEVAAPDDPALAALVAPTVIRWELAADGAGTRLTLTQTSAATAFLPQGAAGWHGFLDRLTGHLAGGPVVRGDGPVWVARREAYAARFEIPADPDA